MPSLVKSGAIKHESLYAPHGTLYGSVLELIRLCSTTLPPDIVEALSKALNVEEGGSIAKNVLDSVLSNIEMAKSGSTPICQDTGSLAFYVHYPFGVSQMKLRALINEAVQEATKKQYLRPNVVDPISGKNTGTGVGLETPHIHFDEWDKDEVEIRLILKGGGCENVGIQYALPHGELGASRSNDGVQKVVMDGVHKAQGMGCAPGIIGVGIGGDRITSMEMAKRQLFRKIGNRNHDPVISEMETELVTNLNKLGIGPMGFGGISTALDVFCGVIPRHPATYYVSISYNCWALRRYTMTISYDRANGTLGEASYD